MKAAVAPSYSNQSEAEARAALVRAFHELTDVHFLTLVGAAKTLGVSPSTMSGKKSLPTRFKAGGIAALQPKARIPGTQISKAVARVRRGEVVFDGHVLGRES